MSMTVYHISVLLGALLADVSNSHFDIQRLK
jgi:hypothetical protein